MKLMSLFWLVRGRGSSLARSALPPAPNQFRLYLPPHHAPGPRPGPPRPSAGWRGGLGAGRAAVTALVTSAGRGRGGGGAGEREPRGGAILASSAAGQPFTGLGCRARQQTRPAVTAPRPASPHQTTMSWQSYVDDQLISTKVIKNAVIAGHDGNIWASSAGFPVSIAPRRPTLCRNTLAKTKELRLYFAR